MRGSRRKNDVRGRQVIGPGAQNLHVNTQSETMMKSEPLASNTPEMGADTVDLWTIISIAIVSYASATMLHEGVGHGGACVLTGGKPVAVSTVDSECDREGRIVAAGGTVTNLGAGLLCWLFLRFVTRSTHLRYFLWLLMTINLLQASGYFLFSGVANIGDWAVIIRGLKPAWFWRMGLTILGLGLYMLFVWIAVREIQPFLGYNGPEKLQRAKKLTLVPYFTGGILSCTAALFNPGGMFLLAISAAASSFGGTSGLAWMWRIAKHVRVPNSAVEPPPLSPSRGWTIGAAVVGALFVVVFGPGLKFGSKT
jgi:hypothetical protein